MGITSATSTSPYTNLLASVSAQDASMNQVLALAGQTSGVSTTQNTDSAAPSSKLSQVFAEALQEQTYQSPVPSVPQGSDSLTISPAATLAATQALDATTNTQSSASTVSTNTTQTSDPSAALLEQAYRSPLASSLQGPSLPGDSIQNPTFQPVNAAAAISGLGAFNGGRAGGQEAFQQLAAMGQGASSAQASANGNYMMMQQLLASEKSTNSLDVMA